MSEFFGAEGAAHFELEQLRDTVLMLPYIASVAATMPRWMKRWKYFR